MLTTRPTRADTRHPRVATPADTLGVEGHVEVGVGARPRDPESVRAGEVREERPGVAVESDRSLDVAGRRMVGVHAEVEDRHRVVRGVVGVEPREGVPEATDIDVQLARVEAVSGRVSTTRRVR